MHFLQRILTNTAECLNVKELNPLMPLKGQTY